MRPPHAIPDLAAHALAPSAGRRVIASVSGDPASERTAGQLLRDAELLQRALKAAGLSTGEAVLLEGLTGARFVTACLAIWESDAIAIPADPSAAPGELAMLRATFMTRLSLRTGGGPGGLAPVPAPPVAGRRLEPPPGTALIKMTSGSTGRPRGVAASADQLLADGRHIIEGMGVRPDDVNVSAIPLSHSYGLGSLLMPLLMQGTALLLADPRHPESLVRALSAEPPLVFPGVPALFGMLGRPEAPPVRGGGLRLCLSAGALLPAATARAFRDRIGQPVRAFYGTSETGGICFDSSAEGDAAETHEGSVGSALPGVDVSLDPATGRVVVRGDAVAIGYLPAENAAAGAPDGHAPGGAAAPGRFQDGAFLTGDTGSWVAPHAVASCLRLTGRVGDTVNVAGRKVDPAEIERILRGIAGVRDAVVLGVPDAARGEALAACVEAEPGITRERVMERLRAELASHKLPRRLVFMDRLPRNERGKTDKDALRRALRDASEAS
jgi:acyl-CoA synthetase (AMP-forming)/AMP-acid ligase II